MKKLELPTLEQMQKAVFAREASMVKLGELRGNPIWLDLGNHPDIEKREEEYLIALKVLRSVFYLGGKK